MTKKKIIESIDPRFLDGIAHRGLHNDKYTENGLKAFKNAIDHDVAFEFDIHLTKDNEFVVCHDEDLVRTTGKNGIIEDMTVKEIKENYRLLDGGEVPTFDEVLALNDEKVPMVIELKVFRKNYKEVAKRFLDYVPTFKDKRKILFISFDPRSLWPLRKTKFIRSLLVAKSDEYTYPFRHTVECVDLDKELFLENRVKRYSKNHFIIAWTIENEKDLNDVLPYVDSVTYQYLDPEVVKKTLNNK